MRPSKDTIYQFIGNFIVLTLSSVIPAIVIMWPDPTWPRPGYILALLLLILIVSFLETITIRYLKRKKKRK